MSHHTLSIAPGVVIEHVGSDVVLLVPGSTEVIKLSGDAAHIIRAIQAGDVSVLPSESVSELVNLGIFVSQAGMSRRGLIKAGAIGAGAGIAAMAMPSVAAASSIEPIPLVGYFYPNFANFTFAIGGITESPFPDSTPSDDFDDVSDLSILGTTVGNIDGAPGVIILWTGTVPSAPFDGVEGNFTWKNPDGTLTHYRVTFFAD
jgi:hypothetical protein